jgi:hypothetical protein
MKWLKSKDEINQIRKRLDKQGVSPDPEIDKFYNTLDDDCSVEDYLHKHEFGEWLSTNKVPDNYDRTRPKYEAFIGGFLYYFEKHISPRKNDNRTLYFDWGKINKKAKLTIYLKPLFNRHIPPKKLGKNNKIWQQREMVAPSPGTSIRGIDPPSPPPPPPPPRD